MAVYKPKTTTSPSRNGFDLTYRTTFTTAGCQLLPVMSKPMIPGDKFRLKLANLTNAENLNKAAFARLEEHYDVFFVPMKQLWRSFDDFMKQTNEGTSMADQTWQNAGTNFVPSEVPNFNIFTWYKDLEANYEDQTWVDELGYDRMTSIRKLLDYLGYSNQLHELLQAEPNVSAYYLNLWPALAYQKIYNDFYRDQNWERVQVGSFNVDDYISSQQVITSTLRLNEIFRLRYVNLKKDYFTGLYPSPTFGDVSLISGPVVSSNFTSANQSASSNMYVAGSSNTNYADGQLFNTNANIGGFKAQISLLELWQARALQRWKDVTLSNRKDYASQLKAHFGVKPSDTCTTTVRFEGGFTNNMDIEQVVSTTPGSAGELGQVGSNLRGFHASAKDETIEISSGDEYGICMVIYYILPLPDISAFGIDRHNTKLVPTDYPMAEFENVGLQAIEQTELNLLNANNVGTYLSLFPLGYSNRYLEYKGAYDVVHDDFCYGKSKQEYVVTFTPQVQSVGNANPNTNYLYFKANPHMLDNIFAIPYDGSRATEPFRNTTYINLTSVRNLSVDGMPY